MKVYNELISKSIGELVDWLDGYDNLDMHLWDKWFDENYCSKCTPVTTDEPNVHWGKEYSWCELNGKCRYFKYMKEIPNNKQVIKMWLESEN